MKLYFSLFWLMFCDDKYQVFSNLKRKKMFSTVLDWGG